MARVAVVGAGVGGLATAIRLAGAGHSVDVYEKNEVAGGKLASRAVDGYKFDIGPSLLTMPQYFDDLGVTFERTRLEAPFKYEFSDHSTIDIDALEGQTRLEFDELMKRGQRAWEVSERTFLNQPMGARALTSLRSPSDFAAIDPFRTLHQRSVRLFSDPRMQQWLDRYATYSGSSPFKAPATFMLIPYIEQKYGAWHVPGGLARIVGAMVERAEHLGAKVHLNAEVHSLDDIEADVTVANVDAQVLYTKLAPNPLQLWRLRRAGRSTAGFSMLLGLSGRTPGLRHHNVWFSPDYKTEFHQIETNGVADDPTIYVCHSGDAPEGCENWFVLVNVKAGTQVDWKTYGDRIIDRLGVRGRVVLREDLSPQFYEQRYGAPGGAIYGTSSDGKFAAFLRTNNRGPSKGLYVVGGSSHPGGGLPLVLTSARIVADAIDKDGWK